MFLRHFASTTRYIMGRMWDASYWEAFWCRDPRYRELRPNLCITFTTFLLSARYFLLFFKND